MNLCLSTATLHSNNSLIKPGRSSWTLTDQACTAPILSSCCSRARCSCLRFTQPGGEELVLQHHKELTSNPPTPHSLCKGLFQQIFPGKARRNSAPVAEGWGIHCSPVTHLAGHSHMLVETNTLPRSFHALSMLFYHEGSLQSFPSSPHQSWESIVVV